MLAHEIGHHSSDHIPKGIAWYALFALPGAYLIARLTRRRGGMRSPEAVPLSLLVIAVLQLAALPVTSAITRRMEAEADWKALESTRDPAAARGAFRGLARTSLGDPDPPLLLHLLLDSHPSLARARRDGEAWQERQLVRRQFPRPQDARHDLVADRERRGRTRRRRVADVEHAVVALEDEVVHEGAVGREGLRTDARRTGQRDRPPGALAAASAHHAHEQPARPVAGELGGTGAPVAAGKAAEAGRRERVPEIPRAHVPAAVAVPREGEDGVRARATSPRRAVASCALRGRERSGRGPGRRAR